jgi:hypothetical protein
MCGRSRRRLPPQLIELAREEPYARSLTSSNNYRIDVSHWQFSSRSIDDDKFSVLPPSATLTITELLASVTDLGFISSQIMQSSYPRIIRMVFQTEQGAQSFLDALRLKVGRSNSCSWVFTS